MIVYSSLRVFKLSSMRLQNHLKKMLVPTMTQVWEWAPLKQCLKFWISNQACSRRESGTTLLVISSRPPELWLVDVLKRKNLRRKREWNLRRRARVRETNLCIKLVLDPIILPLILLTIGQFNELNFQSLVIPSRHEGAAATLHTVNLILILKGNLASLRM